MSEKRTNISSVHHNVDAEVPCNVGSTIRNDDHFSKEMECYEAGFDDGFNEGICHVLSLMYEEQRK